MYFAYLDEFGHIGPYISRSSKKHNESPVFGLAGIILPENAIRPFATYFLKQKEFAFSFEIEKSGKMAAKWEKKGTSFIRPKPLQEYVEMRRLLHRILNKVDDLGGNVFYYGREKKRGYHENLNPTGLYTTCFAHALRRLDKFCEARDTSFITIVDQHSARKELLETAAKTMFGKQPCNRLASPPFEVESYINQNIQAADWIATLVGRLKAFEVEPEQYSDFEYIKTLFANRIGELAKNSLVEKRPRREIEAFNSGHIKTLSELRAKMTK
ncbi:hypothetical protein CEW89_08980 [Celeribacter ethanolicus]|uniref:DUF3800 domain-containing protein n=1 Tax=Celeribacter ethanolicus TaxID=1758178 RepID=A0A291GAY0_9RHOB|nr:DUF3800 domain-containing protein [Celeribacter ethanolicus]ATG47693.1 hypothetical protein CEW89_08980 [Celeribacter ethanolicus]